MEFIINRNSGPALVCASFFPNTRSPITIFPDARRIPQIPKNCLFCEEKSPTPDMPSAFIYSPRIYSHLDFLVLQTATSRMRRRASTWGGKENNPTGITMALRFERGCSSHGNELRDQNGTTFQMFPFIHPYESAGEIWLSVTTRAPCINAKQFSAAAFVV